MIDKNLLVYLADDDDDDRLIFEEAISELSGNISLVKANDGIELLQLLSESIRLPDIIFLDLNMPFQGGKETLKALKANKMLNAVPVVVYSTSVNPVDIEETFMHRAFRYLEKPYSMSGMMQKLEMIFSLDLQPLGTISKKDYFISSKEIPGSGHS
jgi:CheY-like chemotaxis protein